MALNLIHLQTFKNLLEIKSFTRTAQRLNMTQPGVSQHVRSLEEYFGEKLLITKGKVMVTTPKGDEVYRYAQNLFQEHEKFKEQLKGDDPRSGLCRMASPGAVGIGLYSELLRINAGAPDLSIQFHYAPNKSVEADLVEDKIELGFMSVEPKNDLLETFPFNHEKLLIVTPRKKAPKTIEDLLKLGFINHPDGRDMANKVFIKNFPKQYRDFDQLKISGGNNQIGRILEPVALGLGFTVIPHFAYEAFQDKKSLQLFTHKHQVTNEIFMVKKKLKTLPQRYDFIVNELKKKIK